MLVQEEIEAGDAATVSYALFGNEYLAFARGEITVERLLMLVDCGRVINPLTAAGQVEGGMAQALGFTLTEEMLGTASANPDIQREFIASKAPDAKTIEEEVAASSADAVVGKSMTVFPKENGKPFIYDYQLKGFLKDACGSLARVPTTF